MPGHFRHDSTRADARTARSPQLCLLRRRLHVVCSLTILLTTNAAAADEPEAQTNTAQTFAATIEPILRQRCYECHSHEAGEASGGLMLDSKAGWTVGGDTGPAIRPGEPEKSLLIKAIGYGEPNMQMPPDGKLPDDEIAALTAWVRGGAFDPREDKSGPQKPVIDLEAGREFWAYRPVMDVTPPVVDKTAWPRSEMDRFILAKLEQQGLVPAADADRATVARRLYFDLTGLPPTPEQIAAFVSDSDPQAYERLVDELLASRAFAERWGRHWLDLARFAESVTLRGLVFPEAWRYRDYVIDSFDRDVPFDMFLREQIAGDLLPATTPEDRKRQLIATTYLTLGNTNLEEQDKTQLRMDVVDEQLDVIGKGILAQTVTCARCHDHKFDPIPTRDYYALAGILRNAETLIDANVSNWIEVPLPAPPQVEQAVAQHEAEVAALQTQIDQARLKEPKSANGNSRARGPLAIADVPGIVVDDSQAMKVGEWKDSTFTGTYVHTGYTHDLNSGKGEKTLTFEPKLPEPGRYEIWMSYSPAADRATAPVTVASADGETTLPIDMRTPPPLGGRFVSLGTFRFEKDGQSYVRIETGNTRGHVTADAVTFIPVAAIAAAEKTFPLRDGSATGAQGGESVAALEARMKKLKAQAPKRPMTMSVREEAQPADIPVHIRGSVHSLGEIVPRGFLQVAAADPSPDIPAGQSGRVELATWLASPENPLTARVFVNRVWHWLFGAGIVRTVDNFGTTGEPPSHPELLDYLAARFVEDGWSVKRLVRSIVLSRTYRQSVAADPRSLTADPENRWLGRANRRRLDAEAIRDAMLVVSGSLTPCGGGRTFPDDLAADYGFATQATCRSVYLPVFRNALPELFEAFDFADPSTVTGRRTASTIPQQALLLMNNPFVIRQADAAGATLSTMDLTADDAVTYAWLSALGRTPTEGERNAVMEFLSQGAMDDDAKWSIVFQSLFASPEFRFLE